MMAKTMRNMQVAAYVPVEDGVQALLQSEVVVEVVKYMDMVPMLMSMEAELEAVGVLIELVMVMVMPDMSISFIK